MGVVWFVFGEVDGLLGLIVDYYVVDIVEVGVVLCGQFVCQFMVVGVEVWKDVIVVVFIGVIGCLNVYECLDVLICDKEGFEQMIGVLVGDVLFVMLILNENGVCYYVDVLNGYKMGFYVDQCDNCVFVVQYVVDCDVLNCFCYIGGFLFVVFKGGVKCVVLIDLLGDVFVFVQQNVVVNGFDVECVIWFDVDVFKMLCCFVDEGE